MGTTVGCTLNNDQFYIDYKKGKNPGMDPVKRFLNSNPAASVVKEFELTGPAQSIVNACASGTDAIGIGASWIEAGLCDLVIAGGTDELCKVTYNGFISLMITDKDPCKPFDQ
jgi:3-oxoacyl-[acyl-carrier-protein] synthase II